MNRGEGSKNFELTLSVPHDERFAVTARLVVVHAAQYAGSGTSAAEAFGHEVEQAVRSHIQLAGANGHVPLLVRCTGGALEVRFDERTITLQV